MRSRGMPRPANRRSPARHLAMWSTLLPIRQLATKYDRSPDSMPQETQLETPPGNELVRDARIMVSRVDLPLPIGPVMTVSESSNSNSKSPRSRPTLRPLSEISFMGFLGREETAGRPFRTALPPYPREGCQMELGRWRPLERMVTPHRRSVEITQVTETPYLVAMALELAPAA